MFKGRFRRSQLGPDAEAPSKYDPKLHYNCFIEAVPARSRPAVYQELLRAKEIYPSHYLPDGRLQLILTNLLAGMDALNAVAEEKYAAYELTKKDLILLMMRDPDLELTFVTKSGIHMHHVEVHRASQIGLDSEQALRRGVAYHNDKQYQRAIACYDEAIKIEPLDFRAWINKIIALSQAGNNREALQLADEILNEHPDVGLLWETKGRVLSDLGRMLEAGECLARAVKLDKKIEHDIKIDKQKDQWYQETAEEARKAGKNPDKDAGFWFTKFAGYIKSANINDKAGENDQASENIGRALMCLQTAAIIGPNLTVISDASAAMLVPPDSPFLEAGKYFESSKTETLRDYYLRMEHINARAAREAEDWFQEIVDEARMAGKDPDNDAHLWFGKFLEFMKAAKQNKNPEERHRLGENVDRALDCLKMAAKIRPEYFVLSDSCGMMLLPPDHFYLAPDHLEKSAKVDTLRDYYLGLERKNTGV